MSAASPLPIGPDRPWLAPLAGYSDLAFRLLCREYGAACAVTEMVSAKGLIYGGKGTTSLLDTCPEDSPLVVQLFGAEPENLARAVRLCREAGRAHFDLNCGCSVRKVLKTGAGAAMLGDPERLTAAARAMVEAAGPSNVGVKLRLGLEAARPVYLEVGKRLEDAGVAWLTLHGRTARQGYTGRADWEAVDLLARAVDLPVMASGDLFTAEDGQACLQGLPEGTGLMYARGALADPAVFARHALLRGQAPAKHPPQDPAGLARLIRRHTELARAHTNEHTALRKMRTFIPRYVKHFPQARALRKAMASCSSWGALRDLVEEHLGAW